MNSFLRGLILFLCFGVVTANAFAVEKATPKFDQRKWKRGWESHNAQSDMQEFVLENETVQKWSELVTVQFFPGLQDKVSQADYLSITKEGLQTACPQAVWTNIRESETNSLYEWTVSGCASAENKSEIARVVRTKAGVHVWHYAIKKTPFPSDKRSEWSKNLDAMQVIS